MVRPAQEWIGLSCSNCSNLHLSVLFLFLFLVSPHILQILGKPSTGKRKQQERVSGCASVYVVRKAEKANVGICFRCCCCCCRSQVKAFERFRGNQIPYTTFCVRSTITTHTGRLCGRQEMKTKNRTKHSTTNSEEKLEKHPYGKPCNLEGNGNENIQSAKTPRQIPIPAPSALIWCYFCLNFGAIGKLGAKRMRKSEGDRCAAGHSLNANVFRWNEAENTKK